MPWQLSSSPPDFLLLTRRWGSEFSSEACLYNIPQVSNECVELFGLLVDVESQ